MASWRWRAYRRPMKRFLTFLVSAGIAWWAWWYTFSVDPGGEGFGWETCDDGEGVCTDDPSVMFLIISIIAGIVAFFALLSTIRLIKRKVRGETVGGPKPTKGFKWVDPATAVSGWGEQVSASLRDGIASAQQAQARAQAVYPAVSDPAQGDPAFGVPTVGNPTMVGQAGVIGSPAAGAPSVGNPAAHNPSAAAPNAAVAASGAASSAAGAAAASASRARVPNAADRAASKERWLRRAGGGGDGAPAAGARSARHTSSLTGVPDVTVPSVPGTATPDPSPAAPAAAATPTTGTLVLRTVGPRDIGVQREVRRLTGFGLEEAKQLLASLESGPQVVVADLPWEEAQEAKRTLLKMGADAEVR